MRRFALVLLCGLVAGGGAGALARKAPPHHAKPKPHHHKKPHKHKPKPKPHRKPAAATPTATPTVPQNTTPATQDPTSTPTDTPPTTTPVTPAAPLAHALGVTEGDAPAGRFTLSLSRTVLGAGSVTVSVHNASQDPHDLRIDTAGGTPVNVWDELPSGTVLDPLSLTLTPGTYRVYCTLPGHAALGMDKQITVSAG